MKKLFYNIGLIIFFPLVLVITLEIMVFTLKEDILREKNLSIVYKNDFKRHKWINSIEADSINILIGGSTTLLGLSSDELNALNPDGSVYINAGKIMMGPLQSYMLLNQLDLSNVKSIYHSLDPLVYTRTFYKYKWEQIFYLEFNFLQSVQFSLEHDIKTFKKRYSFLFKYIFSTSMTMNLNTYGVTDKYGTRYLINNPDKNRFYFNQVEKYGWSELQFDYLEKIEELCRTQNIEFFLFIPPWRSDFNKFYENKYGKEHVAFKKMISNHITSVPVFGKSDIFKTKNDSIFFLDDVHLNEYGKKSSQNISMNYQKIQNYIAKTIHGFEIKKVELFAYLRQLDSILSIDDSSSFLSGCQI